jgi:hypothetical protein
MYQKIVLGLLLVLLGANLATAEVEIFAQLEPKEFAANQAAQLTLTVQGVNAAEPQIPEIEGLRFRFLGQNMHSRWINGQHSASIAFTYLVEAEQAGTYTIEPLQVKVQERIYTAPALLGTVLPAQHAGSREARDPSRLRPNEVEHIGFMQHAVPKERIYIGQIVPFTLKAYFRPGMRIHVKSNPRLVGENFLLHSLDQEPLQIQEEVNGEFYIALIWEGTLSAVKEGNLVLGMEIDAELLIRESKKTDIFGQFLDIDDFFDDIFSRYSRRNFKLSSKETGLLVRALPQEGRPADFQGAIGSFSLAVALRPQEGKVGDPLTLTMKIAGQGNFDQVQAPNLTHTEGWRLYPASARLEQREKIFEQALIPTDEEIKALPPLSFSYFDPIAEKYVSLHSDSIPLNIQGLDEAQPSHLPSLQEIEEQSRPEPQQRLAPPKLNPGEMVQQIEPVYAQLWFILVSLGAACCLGAGLLLDFRRRQRHNNPHHFFVKQMEQEVSQHLEAMRTAAQRQDQEGFRWHGLRAIQKQASTRLAIKPEAITLADIQSWLDADSPLVEIFSQLEQSSYAGMVLTGEAMEAIWASSIQALKQRP